MYKLASFFCVAALVLPNTLDAQSTLPPGLQTTRTPAVIASASNALQSALARATDTGLSDEQLQAFSTEPLASWLEYAALSQRIKTLPVARGAQYLTAYRDTAAASRFRAEWVSALAERNEWQAMLDQWQPDLQDTALRCLSLQARMAVNQADAQWVKDAQTIWASTGSALPKQCDSVITQLKAKGELSPTLLWQRFDQAVDARQTGVMRSIADLLPADDATLISRYIAYLQSPSTAVQQWPKTARSRLVASTALAQLAKNSPAQAETLLASVATALEFTEADRGRVLHPIALWTAASYLPDAARRLAAVPASAYDSNLHEWRVREALSRSDWSAAFNATQLMPEAQRTDSRWLYIAARSSELAGDPSTAQRLFQQAAQKSDFHGFLAADQLNQPYTLCPATVTANNADKQALAANPELIRAIQLFKLNQKAWAVREWNRLVAGLNETQRHLAVEIAQDNGWFDRGVFGLLNVNGKRYPDEQRLYALRFPLHYDSMIQQEATRQNLDPAWVAAEIRAESLFDTSARSSADARGLMQVLPSTGAGVASKIGMPWQGGNSLYDPHTNIRLGTAYLRQLLDRYEGKPYLVIAGYNAGPAPVNRWLTQRANLPADLWIETITYRETREYVARVLSFSTLYDWRFTGNALPVRNRMLGLQEGTRKAFVCPESNTSAPEKKT